MAYGLAWRAGAVLFGLGGACVWLGCNAIAGIQLGTLESTPSDGGMQGGGNDATMMPPSDGGNPVDSGGSPTPDAGPPTDAGGGSNDAGDGGPTFKTYSCAPSGAPPFVVANMQNTDAGGRSFDSHISLGVTTNNQDTRIVVQLVVPPTSGSQPPSEVFRSYDVHWTPKQVDNMVPVIAPQGTHLASTVSTPNGITAIVTQGYYDNDAGNLQTVFAYSLPANVQNLQNNAPPPYQLTTPVQGNNQSAAAIEMGVDDQFLVTNSGPLQSNRASRDGGPTTPTTFADAGPQQGGNDVTLLRGNNGVYAVYGGDPSNDASTLVYKLPLDGGNTQPVTPSLLPTGTLLAAAQPSTVDPTKIATYAATLVLTPTPTFSLFTGLVDSNNFDNLSVSALTPGPSLMLHDVPAGKSTSTWVGDSLVLLGLSPVSSDNGLNFLWVDTSAHVLAEAIGNSRFYNNRPGIQGSAIAQDTNNGIVGVLLSFWVAWTEEQSDTAGTYDILYLDEIQCAAN
jgi:hypothetical protein